MRVLRRAVPERILHRALTVMAAVVVGVFAAGCGADSGDENATDQKLTAQQDAGCESTDLDALCSVTADDESAGDKELNRDELERELDRIEQEITAP